MKRIGLLSEHTSNRDEITFLIDRLKAESDFEVETIDHFQSIDSISKASWGLINLCDVLIVYISKGSPNIFYELGLAHGLGKPVVILTNDMYDFPASLHGQRVITVERKEVLRDNLVFRVKEAISQIGLRKNRVSGFRGPRDEEYQYSFSEYQSQLGFRDLFAYEGASRRRYFESWLADLASSVNGWEVIRSEAERDRRFDLVIWNSIADSELSVLGNPIAIEIKAIQAMNSRILYDFLHRAKKSGLKGFIFATTSANPSIAKKRLQQLRVQEKINAIALDRDDLIDVVRPQDLVLKIKEKIRELLYDEEY